MSKLAPNGMRYGARHTDRAAGSGMGLRLGLGWRAVVAIGAERFQRVGNR